MNYSQSWVLNLRGGGNEENRKKVWLKIAGLPTCIEQPKSGKGVLGKIAGVTDTSK